MKKIVFTFVFALVCQSYAWANDYNAHIDEGNRLWAENNITAAQKAFEKAIKLDPEKAIGHARLAGLLLTNNKNKQAIKAYQKAINADPTNPALFVALGIAYLHEGAYGMAQEMVKQALVLDPEHMNGKKLEEYVNKKMEVIAQTDNPKKAIAPKDSVHQKMNK